MNLVQPLINAILNGEIEEIRFLVGQGANLKSRDQWGRTPLIVCVASRSLNRVEVVRVLIELGSNIDAQNDNGMTALMKACLKGDQAVIAVLLENGADTKIENRNGKSAADFHKLPDCSGLPQKPKSSRRKKAEG